MPFYSFTTIWKFDAPLEKVWTEIECIEQWPQWWNQLLSVEKLQQGDENGIGGVYRLRFRSAMRYVVQFDSHVVEVDELKCIRALAFGELEGTGTWKFSTDENGHTIVQYEWDVKTNKWWMNLIAPFAKPVFVWNHNQLMRNGGESLAKRLQNHSPLTPNGGTINPT